MRTYPSWLHQKIRRAPQNQQTLNGTQRTQLEQRIAVGLVCSLHGPPQHPPVLVLTRYNQLCEFAVLPGRYSEATPWSVDLAGEMVFRQHIRSCSNRHPKVSSGTRR
eukprot:gnl/TRDRNA2_/TRDRNA2_184876_c0_seq1.p1 gnl/TRDRNA2_/TRDRNA2_184876_c0~~gnl/TRDRNA2_/TRDRNA2_184876_c0_seq1.p1  ORF type:complete len:107 (-),score=1.69 gnl/TRDRNA2_/TRDRNA2_184876_c0_seq1:65-385(-)